jgi:hypothetical protein
MKRGMKQGQAMHAYRLWTKVRKSGIETTQGLLRDVLANWPKNDVKQSKPPALLFLLSTTRQSTQHIHGDLTLIDRIDTQSREASSTSCGALSTQVSGFKKEV